MKGEPCAGLKATAIALPACESPEKRLSGRLLHANGCGGQKLLPGPVQALLRK